MTPEKIRGRSDYDLFPKETADVFCEVEDKIMAGESIINYEENYKNAEGNDVCMLSTKVPIYNNNGDTIGIIGVNRNITRRKKMEEDLRNARLKAEQATRAKSASYQEKIIMLKLAMKERANMRRVQIPSDRIWE